MEKNEIRGYEPLVEELKQLIHKKRKRSIGGTLVDLPIFLDN